MPHSAGHDAVQLSAQGRLVIPARLRRALDFKPGDRLIVHQESGRLVLEKANTIERRLKARFAHIPKEDNLADQLIAERRAEARKESDR